MILEIKQNNRGFTLIELLVVISIIGVLSTLILVQVGNARAKARNARQLADLNQLKTALELYSDDNGGSYPVTAVGVWRGDATSYGAFGYGATGYIQNLVPTFILRLPENPNRDRLVHAACGGGGNSGYLYRSDNGTAYKLLAHCTPELSWPATHRFYDPVRPTHTWMVCSGGTACAW